MSWKSQGRNKFILFKRMNETKKLLERNNLSIQTEYFCKEIAITFLYQYQIYFTFINIYSHMHFYKNIFLCNI